MKFQSKFKHFHSTKCILKRHLWNRSHLSRPQNVNWNNVELLSIQPQEIYFSEILLKFKMFHSGKYIWKCPLQKSRPFCSSLIISILMASCSEKKLKNNRLRQVDYVDRVSRGQIRWCHTRGRAMFFRGETMTLMPKRCVLTFLGKTAVKTYFILYDGEVLCYELFRCMFMFGRFQGENDLMIFPGTRWGDICLGWLPIKYWYNNFHQ